MRRRKKNRKLLGTRTHGRGESKRTRGKGNKGGTGHAGLKHKKMYRLKYERESMGKHGFVRPRASRLKRKTKIINLYQLENMCRKGELERINEIYMFTFNGKVLGMGEITVPVIVKALACTETARKKIIGVGGKVERLDKPEVHEEKPERIEKTGKGEEEEASEPGDTAVEKTAETVKGSG